MTWYKACRKILQGALLEMSLVERRGCKADLLLCISLILSSGLTMGIAGVLCAVGLLSLSVGLGCRSWMITGGVCQSVLPIVGLAATLGGGVAGGPLCYS